MTGSQLLTAWAGHFTGAGTGVTVVLPPVGTVASGEVRGGAPATREFALLDPTRLVDRVDAVVLSGGSAFGLSAADGVMNLLRERGAGFPTPVGPVPIVVGMSIFDASAGGTPPDAASGRAAALSALAGDELRSGRVGAGTGATVGKWRGRLDPGGVGIAVRPAGAHQVAALIVVNAWGDVIHGEADGEMSEERPFGLQNTTIGVVLTTARLDKIGCHLLAQSGHTGYARAIHPAHSRYDGDAIVALATGETEEPAPDGPGFSALAGGSAAGSSTADVDLIRAVATTTVAEAIRNAVADQPKVP